MKKSKYMAGGGKSGMKNTKYMAGDTSPAMKKNKTAKGMAVGGMTPARKKKFFDRSNRPTTIAEIQEGLGQVRPGMSKGGKS